MRQKFALMPARKFPAGIQSEICVVVSRAGRYASPVGPVGRFGPRRSGALLRCGLILSRFSVPPTVGHVVLLTSPPLWASFELAAGPLLLPHHFAVASLPPGGVPSPPSPSATLFRWGICSRGGRRRQIQNRRKYSVGQSKKEEYILSCEKNENYPPDGGRKKAPQVRGGRVLWEVILR